MFIFFAVAKVVDDVRATFSSHTPFWVEKKNNVEIRRNVRGVVSAVQIVRRSWQGKRALSGVVDGKLHIISLGCVLCIYIISYIYIYIYMPYSECAWKILWTRRKNGMLENPP